MSVWRPAGLRCFINLAAAAAGLLQTDNTMYSYIRVHRLGEHFHTEYNRHMSITDPLWPTSTYTFPHNFPETVNCQLVADLLRPKYITVYTSFTSFPKFHYNDLLPTSWRLPRLRISYGATCVMDFGHYGFATDLLRRNWCNGFWP